MKSYVALSLLASVALAQSEPNCGVITNPPLDEQTDDVKPIAVAIVAINETTVALNQSINSFDGSTTAIVNLANGANAVLANIQQGNENVSALAPIPDTDEGQIDTFNLVTYIAGLACTVNFTIQNLIDHEQAFIDACVGPVVLSSLLQQQNASTVFEQTVRAKIPESLQSDSDTLVAPVDAALSSGVAAFAAQTTLPASCTPSSTTTTSGSASGSATSGGSSATATGGAGGWATYGWSAVSSSSGSQPTASGVYSWSATSGSTGAQPTGTYGSGSEEDDCEEDDSTSTGSGYSSVYSPVAGGSTWAAVSGPTGGSTGGAKYTTTAGGSTGGAKYTTPASSGWQAVSTGKPWTASNTTWAPYTGAASANMASGMGVAAVAAMAAIAML